MTDKPTATICKACKRVKTSEGWQTRPPPEDIIIAWGMCPECEKKQEKE